MSKRTADKSQISGDYAEGNSSALMLGTVIILLVIWAIFTLMGLTYLQGINPAETVQQLVVQVVKAIALGLFVALPSFVFVLWVIYTCDEC